MLTRVSRVTRLRDGVRALAEETGAPWPLVPRDPRAPDRVRAWSVLALPPRAALTFATTPLDPMWVAHTAALAPIELPRAGEEWVRPWTALLWLAVDSLAETGRLPIPETAAADWIAMPRRGLDTERLTPTLAAELEILTEHEPDVDWSWPLPARSAAVKEATRVKRWWACVEPESAPPAYFARLDHADWQRQLQGAGVDDTAWSGDLPAAATASARSATAWARLRAARFVHSRWLPAVLVGDGDQVLAARAAQGRVPLEDALTWRARATPAHRRSALAAAGYRADDPAGDETPEEDLDVLAALRA
jgi:hypothetical protein